MNVPLKLAIVESRRTQRTLARLARISEVRFSKIVQGDLEPDDREQQKIAALLGKPIAELFPTDTSVREVGG